MVDGLHIMATADMRGNFDSTQTMVQLFILVSATILSIVLLDLATLTAHWLNHIGISAAKAHDQVTNYLETMIFFLKKLLWDPMKVKFRLLWLRWS